MAKLEKGHHWRIRLFGLLFIAALGLVAVRAYYLQVRGQEKWLQRAERQHQRVIPLTPQRGTIYDRNGEALALSIEVDSIYVNPGQVKKAATVARELAPMVGMRKRALKAKLSSRRGFVWLKRQVSPAESLRVKSLGVPGVHFIKEHKRYYPNGSLGAQVLGFTGMDPHGLEGLELRYDNQVLGEGGFLVTERDNLGRGIGAGEGEVSGAQRGGSLHLTLDKNIQYIVEKELDSAVRALKAKAGTALVLNPHSGEILAMASQPDFNPNAFNKYGPANFRNRAIADAYEPGSTLKTFLLASALEQKVVRVGQKIDCEKGSYRVGGKTIHDHHPYGQLSVAEILKYSSNIGAAKVGKALERERFYRALSDFGFGSTTGISLPGESRGLLRRPEEWFEVDLAAISFGQGLTVTPLQLVTAMGAVANGGELMRPYLVERVVDGYGQVEESRGPKVIRRVLSEKTAMTVRTMLEGAVAKGGTGTLAAVPGFTVGGKTGTAQKVDPVTGGYSRDRYLASFVGMVPVDEPRLVILVMVDEPQGVSYGGLVAAPVFSRIASQALAQMKVAPRQPINGPRLMPMPVLVKERAAVMPVAAVVNGKDGAPLMPSFLGMSIRQVLQTMERTGLNISLRGSGRVVAQSPQPGKKVSYGSATWVTLAQSVGQRL